MSPMFRILQDSKSGITGSRKRTLRGLYALRVAAKNRFIAVMMLCYIATYGELQNSPKIFTIRGSKTFVEEIVK